MVWVAVLLLSFSRSVVSDSLQPHGARQAPLSMGFSRPEYWSGLPDPGDFSNPGIVLAFPALAGGFFTNHQGSPVIHLKCQKQEVCSDLLFQSLL